nr:ABC transporter substrate-binding protein [uncultured Aminipila sp.]
MIKKVLIISLTIIICIGIIIYSQHGQMYNLLNKSDEEKIVYTESQTVKLPMEKVRTLNPITSKDSDTYQISKLIFESLFNLDKNLSLTNGLASSYNYAPDKMSVNIEIKTDSYFSNGSNVTGEDVKYSIDNYIAAAASNNTIYSSYVSNIKSVSVGKNDKYSVVIKFKDKSDVSMENFIFPIVSERNFGKYPASKVASSDFIPIGSGAYAIEKYNDISELKLVANENHTGVKPTNTLCFTVLPKRDDVIPLLEVNNISLGCLEALSRDTLVSDKKITASNFVSNEVEVVGYNFSREAMANKKVRKAIAYAIDTKSLNESAYYKNGVACDTIYFPGYLGIKNTGDNYKYNLEKATKLLTSANYLDRDENGYLEDKNENELTVDILVNGADQSRKIAAEAIKASIDKLSISSRIIYAADLADFNSKLHSKNYDIFVGGMKINETYDLRSLLHSDYNNAIGYSNEKVDKLLDKLKSGITQEQKVENIKAIKNIIIDELPYYCILYKTYGALTAECLNGNNNSYMFNNVYNGCESWYCKYPVTATSEIVDSNTNNTSEDE